MKQEIGGWLTSTAAARALGVSRTTVRRWALSGEIPREALVACGRMVRLARWWVEGRSRNEPAAPVVSNQFTWSAKWVNR